jgi:hypothetical protein
MPSGIQSIALFSPVVATNAVFSYRRGKKGVTEMGNNPVYGAMNLDIAAGQTLKGARAVKGIAIANGEESKLLAEGASEAIKDLSQTNKFVKGASKVINYTADHINPIICLTSSIKVLGADDKKDEAIREGLAVTTMLAGTEPLAKKFLGLTKTELVNYKEVEKSFLGFKYKTKVGGEKKVIQPKGLYKELYNYFPKLETQVNNFKNYCNNKTFFGDKKLLKGVPGGIKGLLFVCASIFGYQLGEGVANCILGERKQSA